MIFDVYYAVLLYKNVGLLTFITQFLPLVVLTSIGFLSISLYFKICNMKLERRKEKNNKINNMKKE